MSEHTKGLLRVGKEGIAVVADHPVHDVVDHPFYETLSDPFEYYGGHLVAESVNVANARRIVACWNACLGLPTDELEQRGLASAFGNQLLQVERQRDVLLEALNGVLGVMNNSQGVAGWHKNGDIATWDELLPEVSTALDYVGHPIPSHAEFILGQMMNELQGVMVELDSPGGPVDGSELWERIKAARNRVLIHGALSPQQAQPDTAWTEAATTPTEQDYRELQGRHDKVQSRLKAALDIVRDLVELPYSTGGLIVRLEVRERARDLLAGQVPALVKGRTITEGQEFELTAVLQSIANGFSDDPAHDAAAMLKRIAGEVPWTGDSFQLPPRKGGEPCDSASLSSSPD